jgi:hypothetical protein
VRVAWLVLACGCWTAPGVSGEPRRTEAVEDRPIVRESYPRRSKWTGMYRCSQGWSAVVLDLIAQPDGKLDATFTFGPTPENPTIPMGVYRLSGTIRAFKEGAFQIVLVPTKWVDQPTGYIMVPMSATSSRKWQRLVGTIDHPTCGELDVRRAD